MLPRLALHALLLFAVLQAQMQCVQSVGEPGAELPADAPADPAQQQLWLCVVQAGAATEVLRRKLVASRSQRRADDRAEKRKTPSSSISDVLKCTPRSELPTARREHVKLSPAEQQSREKGPDA